MKTRIVILITSYLAAARRSFFLTAALFVLVTSANAQWIFNPATGHEYRLTCGVYWGASDTSVPTPPDWFDAEAEAVAFGGHLATINDEAENLWLRDTFGDVHYWIGLTDWGSEGSFYWVSGEPVTYLNWDAGQPDNAHAGGEDTVHINHFGSLGWNDLGVQGNSPAHPNPYRGIIEREPGPENDPPLQVTTTNPPVGGTFSPPAPGDYQYDVNFNQAVDPMSVQISDLTLDGAGGSVISVQVINSNTTARFTLHFTLGDSVTASIAAGAITTADPCNGNEAFTANYNVEGSPCIDPPSGMLRWYPGDNNANDIVGTNDGTLVGGVTFSAGMVAQAFNLDGGDDHVQASAFNLPVGNAARTIDLWFRTPRNLATDTESAIVQYGSEVNTEMFGLITSLNAPGKLYFFGYNDDLAGTTTLLPNTWYHGAVTYDGTTVKLYLNGTLEGTLATILNTVANSNDLTIGFRPDANVRWQGQLDEIEIFDRALSQAEIQAIYNAEGVGKCKPTPTCVPPPSGMVSWWPGDGNTDDIIDGNNGAFVGNSTFSMGEVEQAFSFNGRNYVDVPDAANLDFEPNAPITIDMWVFRTSGAAVMHTIGKRDGCGDNSSINYQMGLNNSSREGLFFGDGFGNEVATGQDLPLNTWTHLAGTFDGSTYRFYINGTLAGTAAGTLGPPNDAPLLIGTSGDCETFGGLIDEVELFNRALSEEEIHAIYRAGSAGKCKSTPTPTPSPTATATFTPTPTPTPEESPTPTATATATATATFTPTPTATATFTPTATATATATFTPTPTATATFTPTPTATFTPTPTATFTPTPTPTSTPTSTPAPSPTPTPTSTPTPTPTPTCAAQAQVQPPINADGSSVWTVRRGVVPVKFRLTCDGNQTCDLPPATIAVTRTAGGVIGEINESVYSSPADSGPNFRVLDCQYHYNLTSSALGVGTYRVDILINSQVVGSATFQLK